MTVSPFVVTGQEAGLDDRQYIRRLRELLNDVPKAADEQGTGLGNALRYNLQTVPINDDDMFSVTVDGTQLQVVNTVSPTSTQVFVDFDTGRMIFGNPPSATANNITILKNTVRWRDSTLKEALTDGARMMWPKLGKIATDTSITLATLVWDYQLPSVFNDANIRITDVGIREIPQSTERFRPVTGWERVGNTTLRIPGSQGFSPGATVQIMYEAPYASLSEVEPKAQMLPLWYAAGMLLGFKESQRVRTDTQNVTAEASANPNGSQQNAGAFFMRQYTASLNQMARVRKAQGAQTVYDR
jgi:hypothetical protein